MSSRRGRSALAAVLLAGAAGCPPRAPVPAPPADLAFADRAAELGVRHVLGHGGRSPLNILETIGHGLAWLDYDGDGRLDLLCLGPDAVRLFRNEGGRFTEAGAAAGLPQKGYWIGVAVGDWDNDGRPDLFLNGYDCAALLRNDGGRFADVTRGSGIPARDGWGTSAGFVDLDHDGRLDLVVCRYARFGPESRQFCVEDGLEVMCAPRTYPAEPPRVYRNLGSGRFRDVTRAWGFHDTAGRSLGIVPLDADGDGWTDLYVANDTEPGDLFLSDRGRRWTNAGYRSGTAVAPNGKTLAGMGVDAGDYDRDGRQDLILTTFEGEPKCLWRNLPGGRFAERSDAEGLQSLRGLLGFGVGFGDFDNDGRLDLFFANGHVFDRRTAATHRFAQPARLFRGAASGFDPSQGLAGLPDLVGRGAALGDFDDDGGLDIAVSSLEGNVLVLRNTTAKRGHWLRVRLEGRRSNRMGLGSRVTVTAGAGRWVAEAKTARSVYSAADSRLHFGLGGATGPVKVTVRWPSGRESEHSVEANREATLEEPA